MLVYQRVTVTTYQRVIPCQVFQVLGAAQMSGSLRSLSFPVAMAGLHHWRRFVTQPGAAKVALGFKEGSKAGVPNGFHRVSMGSLWDLMGILIGETIYLIISNQ